MIGKCSSSAPGFRVFQFLEPIYHLRSALFGLCGLSRCFAVEIRQRVIEGLPIMGFQIGMDDLLCHFGRQFGLHRSGTGSLIKHFLRGLM